MSRSGIARPVVLLVDDNEAIRGLLQSILEDHYEVISVSSGEAGLREVAQRRVDMVLLDPVHQAGSAVLGLDQQSAGRGAGGHRGCGRRRR
jgi:CheY-like chemotaxis protein